MDWVASFRGMRNPASGLPMVGGCAGVDIEGNPYGVDFHHDESWSTIDSGIGDGSWMDSSSGSDPFSSNSDSFSSEIGNSWDD